MPRKFEVRRVTVGEWQPVRDLRLRALKTDPLSFGSTYAETFQKQDSSWQSFVSEGALGSKHAIFVACFPSILGMVRAEWLNAEAFGIYSIWVAPEARNKGVAGALLKEIEQWVAGAGGKFCELFVADTALAAQRLYLRCGYEFNGKVDVSPHRGVAELGMTKGIAF